MSAHDIEVGSDTWHWWLEHGLDGIAGGIVGGVLAGLVAWWAVRRTIAHERGLDEKALVVAEERELREAVIDLIATSTRLFTFPQSLAGDAARGWWGELYAAVWKADAIAMRRAKKLSAELTTFRTALIRVGRESPVDDQSRLQDLAADLSVWLTGWLASTERVHAQIHPPWEDKEEAPQS